MGTAVSAPTLSLPPNFDNDNQVFQHAVSFVNQTNRSVFLTGKAGTGKTTFLKYIREHSHKKMVVAAPTGVAAMNAGGMTLHSLFWLPFGLYIGDEEVEPVWDDASATAVYNRRRLFGQIKLTTRKRALLREIELLVIDEVSMVRADVLDAIDTILRSVRRDARPFGGLQILFIGDLFQLPPVVKEQEWRIMSRYYSSSFFFEANVLKENPPVILELEKIYRQNDPNFIGILNAIRTNTCTSDQLDTLNTYYDPEFTPGAGTSYITLTSHNHRADEINQRQLQALSAKSTTLTARIKGDFSMPLYPADNELTLKTGAQVMFIRNDSGEDRRYYNGKIGHVEHIDSSGDRIIVAFGDGSDSVEVKRETWENIRYDYDREKDKINEDVLGSFSQFPLRLAWAITIHKSQGLTFERAIIDAGSSFAAGQVYVAISRLTTLEGLVLRSRIPRHSIRTDPAVLDFSNATARAEDLPALLADSQRNYLGHILLESFKWDALTAATVGQLQAMEKRSIPDKEQACRFLQVLKLAVEAQDEVAEKFRAQLQKLLRRGHESDDATIFERITKAVDWFRPRLEEHLIDALAAHIHQWQTKKRTKRYITDLQKLQDDFKRKQTQLAHCMEIAENLSKTLSS